MVIMLVCYINSPLERGTHYASQAFLTATVSVRLATAWRVLRLRLEETADKGLFSSLGVERQSNNSSP